MGLRPHCLCRLFLLGSLHGLFTCRDTDLARYALSGVLALQMTLSPSTELTFHRARCPFSALVPVFQIARLFKLGLILTTESVS
ncbi:hypothetical protein EDD18DRAFT_15713 [Armillaria luteobubalina]|uniref:Secreted protein n=1 Tax=Armillaria luteobubalina TaxID=153913 RepID=A0AA39QQG3_9AGAR|nr:hypothetical protein EDD18DRAFT_15713 [Armillaria luteobubalina]